MIELRRLLTSVHRRYTGLVELWPELITSRPSDPVASCQLLGLMADQLDDLSWQIAELRRHVDLLFDLSAQTDLRSGRQV